MRSCFEGRERMELLSLALMCCRLIDVAIEADREKKSEWWPEDQDFDYNKRGPSYAKTWLVCHVLGDAESGEHRAMLKAMKPKQAIETLHRMEKLALWYSDRGVPEPDLRRLMWQQ